MNKVYLITGGGHFPGIGSCVAEHVLRSGNRVVVNSRSFDKKWLQDLSAEFANDLILVPGDISDASVQDRFIMSAVAAWGRIDTIVNNASSVAVSGQPGRDEWNNEFLLNVVVPYELAIKAAGYLRDSRGSIVMIGSRFGIQVAQRGSKDSPAYSIAKAAMHQLTKNLAVMLKPVRVNAVAPGMFESARWSNKFSGKEEILRQDFVDSSLTGDTVSADGLVSAVMLLAENPNITGQILPVCNGTSIPRVANS